MYHTSCALLNSNQGPPGYEPGELPTAPRRDIKKHKNNNEFIDGFLTTIKPHYILSTLFSHYKLVHDANFLCRKD